MSKYVILYGDESPSQLAVLEALFEKDNKIGVKHFESFEGLTAALDESPAALVLLGQKLSDCSAAEAVRSFHQDPDFSHRFIVFGDQKGVNPIDYLKYGASDYMTIPFRRDELVGKINYYVRIAAQESARVALFDCRYEPLELLGEGGFGNVYLAIDHEAPSAPKVALKTYEILPGDNMFRSRYLQEVFQLSRLHHPNIVRLIDFGKTHSRYYVVTEYVDGQTLHDALNEVRKINGLNAALIGYYVGQALQHMANCKVVHRDLNPKNIMLTQDGDVKVVDFGLAKTVAAATLNNEDQFQATPYYVAPEYIMDEEVSVKTDIYSLAVTLYYALTGRFPFPGTTAEEVIQAHLEHTPEPLTEILPSIDLQLSDLIACSLAREQEGRPEIDTFVAVMKEVFEALSAEAQGNPRPAKKTGVKVSAGRSQLQWRAPQ